MCKKRSFGTSSSIYLLVCTVLIFSSCTTAPPEEEPVAEEIPEQTEDMVEPDSVTEDTAPDEEFVVTEELYEQTFDEVETVITTLNEIIGRGDFDSWKNYLTQEYIDAVTEPGHLEELNQSPLLSRNNIELESLEDYFRYVVVPSRANLRLDDLEFIDDNTVQAIMIVRDRRAILYLLRRIDGEWRISV
ncbi:MAG: hypothetical protein ACOC0D_07785 [Spirochaeta sp.]